MKSEIIKIAKDNLADIIGFASADAFERDDAIFKIYPETKTVIALAFRVLRGIYRGTEEGTTYYQYTTMGVENMEETIMPMAQLKVANFIESKGFTAIPQRRHQQIMAEQNSTNPEVAYDAVYRNKTAENQMNFTDAAVKCGIGEKGLSGAVLTKDFGPMIRYCFILTDAVIEPDEIKEQSLCDKCGKCIKACPGKAISETGEVDPWQCAVYYNGANGTKNPFMPPDAFADLENRIEIISGEAKVTPETARKILDEIFFYPPAQHAYQCSICGRACDTACYIHLEEKGALNKKFNRKFRTLEPWEFSVEDFKK
ncbi:MAG: 4Fe-4S binding protein [Acutalibacteraceae bacterium]|nr:4Fe-4S binding protein [Acutalibacteraceae bacterium]